MAVSKFNAAFDVLPEPKNYAWALRAIGQDLTKLYPEELEIQVEGAEFIASGVAVPQPAQEQAKHRSTAQMVWNRLMGKQTSHGCSAASPQRQRFTRKYTLGDINCINEKHLPARANPDGKPDIYSLSERLRTVGRIVDAYYGTLLRIVRANNSIKFEYRDKDGIEYEEEYTNLALYKYQQRSLSKRGTIPFIDP